MEDQSDYKSVIQNAGFTNLWSNQILVQLAYNSLNFALIIWVFRLTDSNTAVSALLFAVYLPAVLLGLIAGVLVDAIDRKQIILTINILLCILFSLLIFFKGSFPLVLLLTFLVNALVQFYIPAESSAIPMLVKKSQLFQANSLFTTTLFMTFLLGYGISGPVIAHFGINFVFLGGSIFLLIAFILANKFPSITTPSNVLAKRLLSSISERKIGDIREVLKIETRRTINLVKGKLPVATSILILAGIQAMIGVMAVLTPSFLERVLQISATDASYILIAPLGLGMIIGALVVGRLGHLIPKRKLVGRAIITAGLLLSLVGVAPLISPAIQHFPRPMPLPFFHQPSLSLILIIGSFLLGASLVSVLIPSQTVLQENTPERDRGKVFAFLSVAMSGFSLLPVLFAGILADIFGTMPIFIGLGGLIFLIGLFTLKPDFFFEDYHLPQTLKEFLGLGHWGK